MAYNTKLLLFLGYLLAMVLFISSEVAAREMAETANAIDTSKEGETADKGALEDAKYGGYGYGYPRYGYGGYGGYRGGYGYGGYGRRGGYGYGYGPGYGGGYPRYGGYGPGYGGGYGGGYGRYPGYGGGYPADEVNTKNKN